MNLWLILTLGGILCVAFAEVAQKLVISGKSNISAETNNFVVWSIQGFLALLFVLIFAPKDFPLLSHLTLGYFWIVPIFYFLAGTLYYSSFKEGSISFSSILVGISSVVSTFFGILFFHESTNYLKFVGLFLILLSILIVHYSKSEKLTKSNLLALAGGIVFGFTYLLDKRFVLEIRPHLYQIIMCFSVAIVSLVFRGRKIISEFNQIKKSDLLTMFLSALFFFGYNKLFFLAYSVGGEVGRVDAVNNTVIFLIIALEYLFLKNRDNLSRKLIAATIAFLGVTLLSLAK